jgi:hypothetical protein
VVWVNYNNLQNPHLIKRYGSSELRDEVRRETPVFAPFISTSEHFTKTGPGQT